MSRAVYRQFNSAPNEKLRRSTRVLAKNPKDSDALHEFGEWCKARLSKPIVQQSKFEY